MTYHISTLGSYGRRVDHDLNGYVPTADTGPWDMAYDHGSERTHDEDGEVTAYGEWWEDEGFPAILAAAIKATAEAEAGIAKH